MENDLISRQAAIDAIVAQTIGYTVDEIKAECEENIFNENGYLGGLKDAIEAIEDISSAQPDIHPDGTLMIDVLDLDKVSRVLVGNGRWCKVFYMDDSEREADG